MPKNYSEIYTSVYTDGTSMSFGNAMLRGNGVPLDITEVYDSYAAAVNYAANNPVAYEGQLLAVTENGDTTVYVITPKSQGTIQIDPDMDGVTQEVDVYIKEVGSMPTADGVTIELVDGALKLVGLAGLDSAKTYQPVLVNGKLTWQEPSTTTVEGLDTRLQAAEEDIDNIQSVVGNTESGLVKDVTDVKAAASANAANITKLEEDYGKADASLKSELQTEIQTAVSTALAEAKKYADDNDSDTVYDDTDVRALIKAAQDKADAVARDLATESDDRSSADTALEASLKAYVGEEIGKQAHFSAKVVDSTDDMKDSTTLYLMKTAESGEDQYEEWMLIEGTPVKIGTTATDLTDYVTNDALDTALSTQKSDLEAQIGTVSDKLAEDKAELAEQISDVSGDLSSFKTSVSETYETKATVKQRDDELQAAIDELAGEVAKKADAGISADIAEAADAAAAAQTKANENAEAISSLQAADESLGNRVKSLEDVGAEKNVIADVSEEFTIDSETRKLSVNKISTDKVDGLNATLSDQSDRIDGKVSTKTSEYNGAQVEWRLLTPQEQAKLAALTIGDNGNIELSGKVTAQNVEGLSEFLTQNRDSIAGLLSVENQAKLESVESGAQANVLEGIRINNGTPLTILADKTVNIPFATNDTYGVVLSSYGENMVSVKDDGTMEVNSLNVNRLQQTEGDTLILNGGNSSV